MTEAYLEGFCKMAEACGVDPVWMAKSAGIPPQFLARNIGRTVMRAAGAGVRRLPRLPKDVATSRAVKTYTSLGRVKPEDVGLVNAIRNTRFIDRANQIRNAIRARLSNISTARDVLTAHYPVSGAQATAQHGILDAATKATEGHATRLNRIEADMIRTLLDIPVRGGH